MATATARNGLERPEREQDSTAGGERERMR